MKAISVAAAAIRDGNKVYTTQRGEVIMKKLIASGIAAVPVFGTTAGFAGGFFETTGWTGGDREVFTR